MTSILLSIVAGLGTYLVVSASLSHRGERRGRRSRVGRHERLVARIGVGPASIRSLAHVVLGPAAASACVGALVFGGVVAAVATGGFTAALVLGALRHRERRRRSIAQDAWPTMLEEVRVSVGSIGRSIPQALFESGASAPVELRPSFRAAHREWLLSTDFARAIAVLERELADATADAICETLLVAHELGGADVDRRLGELVDDRRDELRYRKDVRARQAGVRFARRFVLLVPLGMAAAGLSIGDGRDAYATATGQLAVSVALVVVAACWLWAGRLLRLPTDERLVHDQL